MKYVILVVAALSALCSFGQVGDDFPQISGETLDDQILTVPDDARGKYTLVALASSEKAEEVLRTWYEPVYNHFIIKTGMFDDQFDVNVYFIPMFDEGQGIAKNKVMKSIRKESESDELFSYVLFYQGEKDPYEKQLKMRNDNTPYIFLLDPDGEIAYATSGNFEQGKMDAIDEVMID